MSQSAAIAEPSAARANAPGSSQYVTFVCAGVEYGVEILRVQEIKGWDGVTRVPYTPPYVLGVMNLRGVIVPVIDLRARFGLESKPFDSSTVVIVVRVDARGGREDRRHRGRRGLGGLQRGRRCGEADAGSGRQRRRRLRQRTHVGGRQDGDAARHEPPGRLEHRL